MMLVAKRLEQGRGGSNGLRDLAGRRPGGGGGVDEAHFHRQFDVNVLGPLLASTEAVKHFGPAGGSIVNISSGASTLTPANTAVYSATKAAVAGTEPVTEKEVPRGRV
jgi:3-oxoacyl-[acyl-carrier protein] reductase